MAIIRPVSDLRNYNKVLQHVKPNRPVYLTKNGVGEYMITKINNKHDEDVDLFAWMTEEELLESMEESRGQIKNGEYITLED